MKRGKKLERERERERERRTLQLGDDPCSSVANAFRCEIPKQPCFLETPKSPFLCSFEGCRFLKTSLQNCDLKTKRTGRTLKKKMGLLVPNYIMITRRTGDVLDVFVRSISG